MSGGVGTFRWFLGLRITRPPGVVMKERFQYFYYHSIENPRIYTSLWEVILVFLLNLPRQDERQVKNAFRFPHGGLAMSPRLCATLIALLGSLSLAVPAAWAAPSFGSASIAPVVFYTTPGSTCTAQLPNSVTLPTATGTGTISYAIASLPTGVSLSGNTLSGDPATVAASTATTYTYIATDSADSQTASLSFTLEVVSERAILQALFNNTDGPNWTTKTGGWANPITASCLNDLHGVEVGGTQVALEFEGRVTNIHLTGNNLTGSIPPEIGNLSQLVHLGLDGNELSGSIPPEIGNLSLLAQLLLDGNELSGSIPTQIGNLTNLQILKLDGNELSGSIPTEIGSLTKLLEPYAFRLMHSRHE